MSKGTSIAMRSFIKPFRIIRLSAFVLILLTGLLLPSRLHAADVSVSAELSHPQISPGEMAELQIKVSGAQQADVPQQIQVNGLQIRLTGQSTQVQMVNFKVTSSVVYSYIVMPLRTGNFTIPGVTVTADGRQFRTLELSFSVDDSRMASNPPPPSSSQMALPPGIPMPGFQQQRARPVQQQPDEGKLVFGEIHCPKKTLYAGEMTPVEIRYYFDARYPVQVRGRVDFGCEGILVERFPDPQQTREDRDGITYNVLTFHSLLSAVKPGSVDIAPAKLDCEIEIPGALPPGFDDPIFRQLMGGQPGISQSKRVTVKTSGLHLEVLPLPKEGRPESFAGAVGEFDIDSIVSNPHPAAGDPANLVVKIGGRGNFKGMGAPVLTQTEGWRSYPPSDKFDSSDELSYTGVKSFDFTLIAQQAQKESPGCEFSYFDPTTAKYVTLTTKPLPLVASSGRTPAVDGGTGTTPSSPPPSNSDGQNSTKNVPPKEGEPLPGITLRSWTTPMQRSEFLIATLAMFVATAALAGILAYWKIQSQGGTAASRRRNQIAELRSLLIGGSVDAGASYEAALKYAELVLPPSEKRDDLLAGLTARRDLLKYGSGASLPLPALEHRDLLESLNLTPSSPKAP
jgi:hypothetical protein